MPWNRLLDPTPADKMDLTPPMLPRYRPGAYGAMVARDSGPYVHASDVEAILRELEPHILDREKIALTLALIERLR